VTHASWLCNKGAFRGQLRGAARERALRAVQRMGYELHATHADIQTAPRKLDVSLTVTNTGVAPFYYDWPVELAVVDAANHRIITWNPDWKLSEIVPGEPAIPWRFGGELPQRPSGTCRLLLRVVNPLTRGRAVRFANQSQDQDVPGWLTLGTF
jgi:hypothetical protein